MVVVSGKHAAVARAAEIFGGIEADATDRPQRACPAAFPFGADGLRGVLDHSRLGWLGKTIKRIHVGALAEKMHRNNRLSGRCHQAADGNRIDVEGYGIDVGKDRFGAQARGGASRGEEGEAGHNDLVARPHVRGHQGQQQGIAARGAAHGMFHAAVGGDGLFQIFHFRTKHKGPALAHPAKRRGKLF